jgi:glucose-6-phosphate 1-dehydrogenase
VEDKIVNRLFECVTPVEADSGDACSFDRLKEQLEGLEVARNTGGNRLFCENATCFGASKTRANGP